MWPRPIHRVAAGLGGGFPPGERVRRARAARGDVAGLLSPNVPSDSASPVPILLVRSKELGSTYTRA